MTRATTTLVKRVEKVTFATVAKALDGGMANIPQEDKDVFLLKNGLAGTPCVFMATHSLGGREWRVIKSRQTLRCEDLYFGGAWYVLTDENCTYLRCSSATSGSVLTAERQKDQTWMITLEVPVDDDGKPYEGFYWGRFHRALGSLKRPKEAAPGIV